MLNNLECPSNPELAQLCKGYLAKLWSGQISEKEFLKEVAYIALQDKYGFSDIYPKSLPTPPMQWQEYQRLNPTEKRHFLRDYPDFFERYEVQNYLDGCEMVRRHNLACIWWLEEIRKYIPMEDVINHRKIEQKLEEFRGIRYLNEGVEEVRQMFDGEVV